MSCTVEAHQHLSPLDAVDTHAGPIRVKKIIRTRKVERSCASCRASHKACSGERPCLRCVSLKRGHLCVDGDQKKSGRPVSTKEKNGNQTQSYHNQLKDEAAFMRFTKNSSRDMSVPYARAHPSQPHGSFLFELNESGSSEEDFDLNTVDSGSPPNEEYIDPNAENNSHHGQLLRSSGAADTPSAIVPVWSPSNYQEFPDEDEIFATIMADPPQLSSVVMDNIFNTKVPLLHLGELPPLENSSAHFFDTSFLPVSNATFNDVKMRMRNFNRLTPSEDMCVAACPTMFELVEKSRREMAMRLQLERELALEQLPLCDPLQLKEQVLIIYQSDSPDAGLVHGHVSSPDDFWHSDDPLAMEASEALYNIVKSVESFVATGFHQSNYMTYMAKVQLFWDHYRSRSFMPVAVPTNSFTHGGITLESLPQLAWDTHTVMVDINPAMLTLTGWEADEVRNSMIVKFITAEERVPWAFYHIIALYAPIQRYEFSSYILHRAGFRIKVRVHIECYRADDISQKAVRYIATLRPI